MGGLSFEISPLSFYQVNPVQMEKLYDKALEYAGLTGKETVLDLYCGVGSIGLYCAGQAKEVLGIESVHNAVLDANRNAVINGIVNARFVCGKAEEELPRLLRSDDAESAEARAVKSADVVILDPPRAGCRQELLDAVAEAAPERIVYVSCDPATLARDVKLLGLLGYDFVEATPVDMFPWTGCVETVSYTHLVCSLFPAAPIRSVRMVSIFIWISSASMVNSTFPASISASISFKVLMIRSASCCGMIPCFPSIAACAMLPRMSFLYNLWSNSIEALNSSADEVAAFENLPFQSFMLLYSSFFVLFLDCTDF